MDKYYQIYHLIGSNALIKSAFLGLLSVILAKCVDIVFTIIFKKIVNKTQTHLDDQILKLLHKPVFFTILFLGLNVAIKAANLPEELEFTLIGVLKTIVIIIWLFVSTKILVLSMEWLSKQRVSDFLQKNTLPLFINLGKISIGIFAIYFIFLSWNININGILASAGVLGVVLGLAAKDTVSNFFAGIFLMADSPFKENDYILLDSGERGYVKQMGLRSTRFMTRDDIEITIPNSVIASSKIVNESGGPIESERVRITVLVSYGSDLDQAKEVLVNLASERNDVLKKPTPRVRFREFSEYGLKLQLLFWIEKPENRGKTVDAINTSIYNEFNKKGIIIPYPKIEIVMPK
jgi:small-conductance mechanosensitive channel